VRKLIQGLHRFQTELFSSQQELFERLAHGQQPDALLITCSDSRINPNLITQTEPGELFIVRNAGNLVPAQGSPVGGEMATIEFAVVGLGIRDIIVCGHSHCGAVKALLNPDGIRATMPAMCAWLGHAEATRRLVDEKYAELSPADRLNVAIQENVLQQLENLRTHPAVAAGLARGDLKLHGWVYKFETGEVFAYDPARGQFLPIAGGSADAAWFEVRPASAQRDEINEQEQEEVSSCATKR
jgi:carbonic anhydrase